MDPEELAQILGRAQSARARGFGADEINARIAEVTKGAATDIKSLAALNAQQPALKLTPEQSAQFGNLPDVDIPFSFPGLPGGTRINPRGLESGVREFIEGLSFGGQGEIAGAISAAIPGGPGFSEGMAIADAKRQQFGEAHPVLAPALQISGALAGGVAAPAAAGVLRGGGLLSTIARGVGIGGAEGATAGALSSEPGQRRQGAVAGGLIGTILGGATGVAATVPRVVGGIRNFIRKLKNRPSSTSTQTATDAAQVAKSELLRSDTPFDLETIGADVARARKFAGDPDNFVLADHDAFRSLGNQARRFSKETNLTEVFDDALSGRGANLASTAAMVVAQPGVATARAVGSEARSAFSKIKARQFRAVMKRLADDLFNPNPQVQAELLRAMGARPVRRPGPINPLIGLGSAAAQQLLGQ